VAGFATVANPALLLEDGALRIFFGAQRSTASEDPLQGIVTSTSVNGGATWSAPAPTTPCCSQQGTHAGAVSAVRLPDGTPLVFSSGTGFGLVAHRGLSPETPLVNYSDVLQGFGSIAGAAAARERSGAIAVAFEAFAGPRDGVYVQGVNPADGGPAGQPRPLPGLGPGGGAPGTFLSSLQLTRIVARAGGGLYVAFADTGSGGPRTLLWPVGAPRSVVIGRGGGTHHVATVAAAPDGRIWILWTQERAGRVSLVARRSNPLVTRFGERVRIAAPANTQRIHAIDASSQPLRLDVVATVGTFAAGAAGFTHQHTQLLPPLALSATPRSFRGGRRVTVRFTVADVGVPVAGATVRAAGRSARTNARGRATLRLRGPRSGGRIRVTARKRDYRSDRLTLSVKRARR
jgi:hypothetical protein